MTQRIEEIQNLRCFEVTYLPPKNHRGGRVKIKDLRHKHTKILSFTYEYDNISEYALRYLNSKNITVLYKVCLKDKDLLITDNFHEV